MVNSADFTEDFLISRRKPSGLLLSQGILDGFGNESAPLPWLNYLIQLDTRRDIAIVIATNIGGKKANEALFALITELYPKAEKR